MTILCLLQAVLLQRRMNSLPLEIHYQRIITATLLLVVRPMPVAKSYDDNP